GLYPAGSRATDVSWPQCGGTLRGVGALGIADATGGRAFTKNACLAQEYRWASAAGVAPSLYMTLNAAIGSTAANGESGPAGTCGRKDKACQAYNYGWNAAQDAYAYAAGQG